MKEQENPSLESTEEQEELLINLELLKSRVNNSSLWDIPLADRQPWFDNKTGGLNWSVCAESTEEILAVQQYAAKYFFALKKIIRNFGLELTLSIYRAICRYNQQDTRKATFIQYVSSIFRKMIKSKDANALFWSLTPYDYKILKNIRSFLAAMGVNENEVSDDILESISRAFHMKVTTIRLHLHYAYCVNTVTLEEWIGKEEKGNNDDNGNDIESQSILFQESGLEGVKELIAAINMIENPTHRQYMRMFFSNAIIKSIKESPGKVKGPPFHKLIRKIEDSCLETMHREYTLFLYNLDCLQAITLLLLFTQALVYQPIDLSIAAYKHKTPENVSHYKKFFYKIVQITLNP